ncbi:MAG: hypothetical protein AAF639_07340, partial [Chloroflexota bacterium]
LIALIITFGTNTASAAKLSLLGVTMILLLGIILMGEGAICIIIAAPLFYLVALLILKFNERLHGRFMLVPLLLFSMEGTTGFLSFDRMATASATQIVIVSTDDIRRSLSQTPVFDQELPTFLQLGFPTPTVTAGEGLEVGNRRHITFTKGELLLEIAAVTDNSIHFGFVQDTTPISQWLTWESALVTWQALPDGTTEVTWTLNYQRDLDPAMYFGPLESHGAHLAAEYLLETVAIPQ